MQCITSYQYRHQPAPNPHRSLPPPHDKKAVREFAYLALITRSVSSVINEVGENEGGRRVREGGGGGHRFNLIMFLSW